MFSRRHSTLPKLTRRHHKIGQKYIWNPHDHRIYYVNIDLHHQYGISARAADVPWRETSPAAKSEKKRMFSQASGEGKKRWQKCYLRARVSGQTLKSGPLKMHSSLQG